MATKKRCGLCGTVLFISKRNCKKCSKILRETKHHYSYARCHCGNLMSAVSQQCTKCYQAKRRKVQSDPVELVKQGIPIKEIAKQFGCSRQYIYFVLQKSNIDYKNHLYDKRCQECGKQFLGKCDTRRFCSDCQLKRRVSNKCKCGNRKSKHSKTCVQCRSTYKASRPEIAQMYLAKVSVRDIATKIGCSIPYVYMVLREHNIQRGKIFTGER